MGRSGRTASARRASAAQPRRTAGAQGAVVIGGTREMRVAVEQVRSVLTPDLLDPKWAKRVDETTHPMTGYCSPAAEALYHMFGGKPAGWVPVVLRLDAETTHWWLRGPNGEIVDPTADQFSFPVPYERGKGCGFQTPGGIPSKRAQKIIDRVNDDAVAKAA